MFGESWKIRVCIVMFYLQSILLGAVSTHRLKTRGQGQILNDNNPYQPEVTQKMLPLLEELMLPLQEQEQPISSEQQLHPATAPLEDIILDQVVGQKKVHLVDECMKVSLDDGVYHYKSAGGGGVCGLFLVADPDQTITIHVDYIDVGCEQGGLISVVDGWELNGEVFPSPGDHEKNFKDRFVDLCVEPLSRRKEQQLGRTFTSSQNAALVQYRVPERGQGFSVRVKHVANPNPCNILVQDMEAVYKLENFGARRNCSLSTLFDAKLRLLYMSTGLAPARGSQARYFPSSFYHKCGKLGLEDYVQIGGSSGLDSSKMELIDEFCGYQTRPMGGVTTVLCGITTVRLVSSGKYNNKVILEVRKADLLDDMESANYICGI